MESIVLNTFELPSGGKYYKFTEIKIGVRFISPEIAPAEPITKPAPTTTPQPSKDDPFNVPAPLVNPTPKGIY